MTSSALFSQGELADAAFALLTSSSLERYARMAQRAAMQAHLREQLRMNPEMIPELIGQANALRRALLRSAQRDVSEVELAMLLALLARSAAPAIDRLLLDLSVVDRPAVAWVSGLARLLQERRSNAQWTIKHPQPTALPRVTSSSGEVYLGPRMPSGFETVCPKAHASQREGDLAAA
jgi:hypothetical protein